MSFPPTTKKNARLIVSQIILGRSQALKTTYPETTKGRRQELRAIVKDSTSKIVERIGECKPSLAP
jgi:hypothetical protein